MTAEASEAEKVTERIELLTDGDIAKNWYTWLKGEGFGIEYRNIVLEPVEGWYGDSVRFDGVRRYPPP